MSIDQVLTDKIESYKRCGCSHCADFLRTIAHLQVDRRNLRAALTKIEKWQGEFPPTGRTWDDGEEMSYSAAFGSNGERDFMRQVAREALAK